MFDPSAWLFSPSAIVVTIAVAATWAWLAKWPAGLRRFLFIAAAFYLIAGFGVIPITAGRALASGYGRIDPSIIARVPTAIVVLGGGSQTADGWETVLPLLTVPSGARALEAARLFTLTDASLVVASGGESDPGSKQTPSAVLIADALVRLGVPPARIIVESTSLNTRDQVVAVSPILRDRRIEQLLLVTSDLHMRRAIGAFRAAGWAPIAAAAPDIAGPHPWHDVWVPGRGLGFSAQVSHELLGLGYYFARGWWRG